MLTRDQAKAIVQNRLSAPPGAAEFDVVVIDSATIERSFGWAFFWESTRYLETGDFMDRLAGNAPVIVNRFTGDVVTTGTAHPTEYYLAQYEASLSTDGA